MIIVMMVMKGGNGEFASTVPPDRELYVRWAQLTAFLPAMQFSFVPWQYDNETINIVRKFTYLHETSVGDELLAAAKEAVLRGTTDIYLHA